MDESDPPKPPSPSRGRPKTRYADRSEQVRQNMRLYRARQAAEQAALGRSLENLLEAVTGGDLQRTFAAGAAVAGIWQQSLARVKLSGSGATKSKSPKRRRDPDGSATGQG